MDEHEWQPALIRIKHDRTARRLSGWKSSDPYTRKLNGKIVRVRPVDIKNVRLESWRIMGCDSEEFFLVHPEDAGTTRRGVCKCETLTD